MMLLQVISIFFFLIKKIVEYYLVTKLWKLSLQIIDSKNYKN